MKMKENYNQGCLSIAIKGEIIAISGIIIIIEEKRKLP